MSQMKELRDLYIMELQDLYDAEQQLTKALPKLAQKVTSDKLRQAFEGHLETTKQQIERLDQIFQKLGQKPGGKKCVGMEGIIKESQEILKEAKDPQVLDAALIAAAQHAEHYEIAGYGTARTWARMLGENEAAKLLEQTLNEESQTDEKLTKIAEGFVNERAMGQ